MEYFIIGTIMGAFVLIVAKVAQVVSRTPEERTLIRWKSMAKSTWNEAPASAKPMHYAMERRNTIQQLVSTGHGKASASVMAEVDQILATLEATQNAMADLGFGYWRHTGYNDSGQPMQQWTSNNVTAFRDLLDDAKDSLTKLDEIIEHIRNTAREGTRSSVESAKVALQVSCQDYVFQSSAMIETSKDLAERPL